MTVAFQIFLVLITDSTLLAQRIRESKPGDIATGVIVFEDRRQLRLDASPCSATEDKVIVVFRPPYKKVPIGRVPCKDKTYAKTQVIQNQSANSGLKRF